MKKTLTNIKSPFTGGLVYEIEDIAEQVFRKEVYSVHIRYYVCEDTGEQFTNSEQDDLLTNELYSQWRVRHGIPFPEEIKALRLRYGLTYTQMSKIMGFGINQWKLYEDGVVPSESNGKMMRTVEKKNAMLTLLENCRAEFSTSEYNKIFSQVENAKDTCVDEYKVLLIYGKNSSISILNGFGPRNPGKVVTMVKFIVGKCAGICPTKLNKLLFYSDFYHYRKTGRSISGLKYRAIQYGPVPEHYDTIYDNIDGLEKKIEIIYGKEMTSLYVDDKVDCANLSEKELDTLDTIISWLGKMKTKDIVDMSHQEEGWKENEQTHEFIQYSYAFQMDLNERFSSRRSGGDLSP